MNQCWLVIEKRPGYQSGSMSRYQIIYQLVLLFFFCYTRPRIYSAWYQCFRYPENTLLTGYQFHKIEYPIYTPMGTSHTYLEKFYIFHSFFSSFFLHPRAFIELRFDASFALKVKPKVELHLPSSITLNFCFGLGFSAICWNRLLLFQLGFNSHL